MSKLMGPWEDVLFGRNWLPGYAWMKGYTNYSDPPVTPSHSTAWKWQLVSQLKRMGMNITKTKQHVRRDNVELEIV